MDACFRVFTPHHSGKRAGPRQHRSYQGERGRGLLRIGRPGGVPGGPYAAGHACGPGRGEYPGAEHRLHSRPCQGRQRDGGQDYPAPEQEAPQEAAGRVEPEAMEELAGTGEDNEPEDLVQVAKITSRKHRGLNAATLEMTAEYTAVMGHLVAKLPLEFFEHMPTKDAIALKGKVVGFLFNADGEE